MKLKFLFLILFFIVFSNLSAQTPDSNQFNIVDSSIYNTIDDDGLTNFDDKIMLETQIQSQKLLKNLFLAGFVFMSLVVVFLLYINNVKIKQVLEMVKIQERQLDLKNFEIEKLSIILNNTIDSIAIIDSSSKILWCNSSFYSLYGYSKEETASKQIDFFSSDDSNVNELIAKAKNENKPVQFSFSFKNKGNDEIFVQRRIIPITDQKNKVDNFAVIDTDYTALKLALNRK